MFGSNAFVGAVVFEHPKEMMIGQMRAQLIWTDETRRSRSAYGPSMVYGAEPMTFGSEST